jgi:hypothetical protein
MDEEILGSSHVFDQDKLQRAKPKRKSNTQYYAILENSFLRFYMIICSSCVIVFEFLGGRVGESHKNI